MIHIAIPATGEYRKWAEVTAASAVSGSSLPVQVHYIDWKVIKRSRLERLGSWHGSAIAFSRLYLAELFPDLDWIITCDADVLFRGDIAELWALRDDNVSFIAHKDCPLPPHPYTQSHYDWYKKNGFKIKDWSSYFADGMGLVNLKRWREKGYQQEFERLALMYNDWPSPDMMILNYVLQDDKKLLPVEWDCFSGDENADVDWSKSGAVHFVEDTPWRRYKITHLASDLVEEWWDVADRIGVTSTTKGVRGCRNLLDWAWRRALFVFLKRNQWILKLNRKLWLHFRSTRGVNAISPKNTSRSSVLHIIPGINDPTCGIAVAAKMLIKRGVGANGEVWVHSMWTPMIVKASFKALLTGKKLVRMPHGCTDPTKLKHHWYKKFWVAPVERWLFRRAYKIIATCEDEVKWIREFEPKVKKIEILPLFSEDSVRGRKCSSLIRSSAERRDRDDGELRLLYIGRLHPLKGVEFLLQAMGEYQKTFSRMCLKIIGKDEGERDKLLQTAKAYGLNVEFCGVVSEEEKERAWDWCDVLVLPTLSENFGLVVAEALERGRRVITTDGAPAWESSVSGGSGAVVSSEFGVQSSRSGICSGYGGRLLYLKGYKDGSARRRVELLKNALSQVIRK